MEISFDFCYWFISFWYVFEAIVTYGIKTYYYSNIEQVMFDRLNLDMEVYERYLGYGSIEHKLKYIVEKKRHSQLYRDTDCRQ